MTFTLFLRSAQSSVTAKTLDMPRDVQLASAFVSLHLGAVILGGVFIILGNSGAVGALNYLPYPVIAGFLAMIGQAVCQGAYKILHPQTEIEKVALGMALMIAVSAITLKQKGVPTNVSSSTLIVGSLGAFYLWAFFMGKSLADLQDDGWLLPKAPEGHGAVEPLDIFQIDWSSVDFLSCLPDTDAIALLIIACINRSLTTTAIESAVSTEPYSVDNEMMYTGFATLASGVIGGIAMNPTSAMTTLCKEGARDHIVTGRLTVYTVGALHLLIWGSGIPLTAYLPKFLLGGLLMIMGGGMIVDWAYLVSRKLQWTSSAVIYIMLFVSNWGLTYGVFLGLAISMILMNFRFAKLEVLKYHVSGIHFRSGETYNDVQRGVLRKHGDRTQIVGLTGFLFEGVAISLTKFLKEVVRNKTELETLIIDCIACQGINDSACSHIVKVARLCERRRIKLLMCNLAIYDAKLLKKWNLESRWCAIGGSIMDALQEAEQDILNSMNEKHNKPLKKSADGVRERQALADWLGAETADILLNLAHLETIPAEVNLTTQGKRPDMVFLAIPGHSDIQVQVHTGTGHRPAVLNRTLLGAVCGSEALIGSTCRGTWKTRSESVGIFIKHVERLSTLPDTLARLLAVGMHQQCEQHDQLSALYTVSRGGGWHGVTFDASTRGGEAERALDSIGPRLRSSSKHRSHSDWALTDKAAVKDLTAVTVGDRQYEVGGFLDSSSSFHSPNLRPAEMPTIGVGEFYEIDKDDPDGLNNLILNRNSYSESLGKTSGIQYLAALGRNPQRTGGKMPSPEMGSSSTSRLDDLFGSQGSQSPKRGSLDGHGEPRSPVRGASSSSRLDDLFAMDPLPAAAVQDDLFTMRKTGLGCTGRCDSVNGLSGLAAVNEEDAEEGFGGEDSQRSSKGALGRHSLTKSGGTMSRPCTESPFAESPDDSPSSGRSWQRRRSWSDTLKPLLAGEENWMDQQLKLPPQGRQKQPG
jgi:SulP family sulfate permease